jgi:hypothetical protein
MNVIICEVHEIKYNVKVTQSECNLKRSFKAYYTTIIVM